MVAILAALVGVAVPFFQNNINEANQAKARQDLSLIKGAVLRYEQLERKLLTGTSLEPLLGRYLQELPVDPWGNPYLYDGTAGFLGCYGADGLPGGTGGDADLYANGIEVEGRSLPITPVFPVRAQYQGPWGRPRPPGANALGLHDFADLKAGNKLIVTFHRPVHEVDAATLPAGFWFTDPADDGAVGVSAFMTDPAHFLPGTWASAGEVAIFGVEDPAHAPDEGRVALRVAVDNRTYTSGYGVRPSTRLGFRGYNLPTSPPASLVATYTVGATPASPLDPDVYGAEALDMLYPVAGPPSILHDGNDDRADLVGMRIERY